MAATAQGCRAGVSQARVKSLDSLLNAQVARTSLAPDAAAAADADAKAVAVAGRRMRIFSRAGLESLPGVEIEEVDDDFFECARSLLICRKNHECKRTPRSGCATGIPPATVPEGVTSRLAAVLVVTDRRC